MKILERLKEKILILDGALGTMLQQAGLAAGEYPESWAVTRPELLQKIHADYIRAGCDIISTNTFGATGAKLAGSGYSVKEIVFAAVARVKAAIASENAGGRCFTALDVGPTGRLLKPLGDLPFEDAVKYFAETVRAGAEAGADLILIETMSDLRELKAAVVAAKECCDLPVFATVAPDKDGRLLTGGDLSAVTATLEGLRVDALGINCGLGPREMLPLLERLLATSSLPVIFTPNAGLPAEIDGETVYSTDPSEFAGLMAKAAAGGAAVLGGCCGTTPEYMSAAAELCRGIKKKPVTDKGVTTVCGYSSAVAIGDRTVIIGERINPTGKKRLKQALKDGDTAYLQRLAIEQERCGADILDVNAGLPDIDEEAALVSAVEAIQEISALPLQLDSASPGTLAAAMRIYNGKPMVNSVSGSRESMDAIFPLVQKYGGVVAALTLDENGIPETAEGRLAIAERILKEAEGFGIGRKDIIFDPLAMSISAGEGGATETLRAVRLISEKLGAHTMLGVSNVSFGLPSRERLNAAMLTAAMANGLSAAIINPGDDAVTDACRSAEALLGRDRNFAAFIGRFAGRAGGEAYGAGEKKGEFIPAGGLDEAPSAGSLGRAIEAGLKSEAGDIAGRLLAAGCSPMDIVDNGILPALNDIGKKFEAKSVFLPQLLIAAAAAKAAFEAVNAAFRRDGGAEKGTVVIATVKGDIHDIGKNIVRSLLENYRYRVIDLGRDVAPETVVGEAVRVGAKLVGLSALMTTTVGSMRDTVKLLKERLPDCRVMVGGAVLTKAYADEMGADAYVADAMASVRFADSCFL